MQARARDESWKLKKDMTEMSNSFLLRVTVVIKDNQQLSGNGPEPLQEPGYTGNHIAIFECQLKKPPTMALIDHTILVNG